MKIVLTNDDSHRSPLLEVAYRYFSRLGDVRLVVPRHEQSWKAKSMTRFEPVRVEEIELFGGRAFAVEGTPADCVNLAIHTLFSDPPDLIVSGINAGFNIGLGYVLSSGTVGACLEANVAGVPALGLSQAFDTDTRNRYVDEYLINSDRVAIFADHTERILNRLLDILLGRSLRSRVLCSALTWNVNFPFDLTDPRVLRMAELSSARYEAAFVEQGEVTTAGPRVFRHTVVRTSGVVSPLDDHSIMRAGCGAVTALDPWALTGRTPLPIVAEVRAALAEANQGGLE
jgi:5'-nucleotidase